MRLLSTIVELREQLLAMSQAEVARVLLEAIRQDQNTRGLYNLANARFYDGHATRDDEELKDAIAEGWAWLVQNCLLIQTDSNGWMRLTRKGRKVYDVPATFEQIEAYAILSGGILHPKIHEVCSEDFLRGRFDHAIMGAFRHLEIVVREKAGLSKVEYGSPLMRKAFDPTNGNLADPSREQSEKEGDASLFAGAVGAYRNPSNHSITRTRATECARVLTLVSLLLAEVDRRSALSAKSDEVPSKIPGSAAGTGDAAGAKPAAVVPPNAMK